MMTGNEQMILTETPSGAPDASMERVIAHHENVCETGVCQVATLPGSDWVTHTQTTIEREMKMVTDTLCSASPIESVAANTRQLLCEPAA